MLQERKPKAVFRQTHRGPLWLLLDWSAPNGGMLLAPTLSTLIDAARKETLASGT